MSNECEEARSGLQNATEKRVQVQWELRDEKNKQAEYKREMDGAKSEMERANSAYSRAKSEVDTLEHKIAVKKEILRDKPGDEWVKRELSSLKEELGRAKDRRSTAKSRAHDARITYNHYKRKYENKSAYVKEKKNYWDRLTRRIKEWESKVERYCKD